MFWDMFWDRFWDLSGSTATDNRLANHAAQSTIGQQFAQQQQQKAGIAACAVTSGGEPVCSDWLSLGRAAATRAS